MTGRHQMITSGARTVLRAVAMLDIPEPERRLITFLAAQGRNGQWSFYNGGENMPKALAIEMAWTEQMVRRTIASLKRRKWMSVHVDERGKHVIYLNATIGAVADRALARQTVRRSMGWAVSNKLADELASLATQMSEPTRFSDRIRAAAKARYGDTRSLKERDTHSATA